MEDVTIRKQDDNETDQPVIYHLFFPVGKRTSSSRGGERGNQHLIYHLIILNLYLSIIIILFKKKIG